MNIIPKQQLLKRWDSLSDVLKEAATSETNSAIVWKTGEAEHLPKEKLMVVSRLAGYVLMGFIHPEDLARELHDNLGIDKRIAASIAEPINKKIFQPLREELETIYSPAVSGVELPATEESVQTESPKPVLMDSISSVPKFFQTGQIPKPAAPMPTPPAPTQKPATKPVSALNQFSVSRPVPPATPDATVSAAPFMLHMESKAQPLSPSKSGFKIGLSEEQFGKMEQKWAAPPKPAQIETGFTPQPKIEVSKLASLNQFAKLAEKGKGEPDTRVVHYNEMKTPIALAPSKVDSTRSTGSTSSLQARSGQVNSPQVEAPTPKDGSTKLTINKSVLPSPINIQPATVKTVPLPPKPPALNKAEVLMKGKVGIPMPPGIQQKKAEFSVPDKTEKTPVVPQATIQKSAESAKQKNMLSGKPEELDLPAPKV